MARRTRARFRFMGWDGDHRTRDRFNEGCRRYREFVNAAEAVEYVAEYLSRCQPKNASAKAHLEKIEFGPRDIYRWIESDGEWSLVDLPHSWDIPALNKLPYRRTYRPLDTR